MGQLCEMLSTLLQNVWYKLYSMLNLFAFFLLLLLVYIIKLNARSLRVDGVSFQADKRLILNVDKRCDLKRAWVSRLCRSPFTKEERLQKALEYLNAHGAMKVKDYMELTSLSHTVAAKELREFEHDAASGITSIGRLAGKVYVRRIEE